MIIILWAEGRDPGWWQPQVKGGVDVRRIRRADAL